VWQDGTAGTIFTLHIWLYQSSGGLRAMQVCSTVGATVSFVFLVVNFMDNDDFDSEGKKVAAVAQITSMFHLVPTLIALVAECFDDSSVGSSIFLKARNCKTATLVGLYGILNAQIRMQEFKSATYTDDDDGHQTISECNDKCAMNVSIMHLLTYIPFPIVIYAALKWDTQWWSSIEINFEDLGQDFMSLYDDDDDDDDDRDSYTPLENNEIEVAMSSMLGGHLTKVPRINWNEVRTGKMIGSGATATVHLGEYEGRQCAVKKILCTDLTRDTLKVMMQEVGITFALQSETTVKFHGFYISLPEVCLVYDFCPNGTLTDVLEKTFSQDGPPRDMPGPVHFALESIKSIAYLHGFKKPVIHRDIKPSNFLITEDWKVKLADFGEARFGAAGGVPMSVVGSPGYMAPEIMKGKHGQAAYDHRVDIYSFAMVMCQLLKGKTPFEDENLSLWKIQEAVLGGKRPAIAPCPDAFKKLIEDGWQMDPKDRPTAKELVKALEQIKESWNPKYDSLLSGSLSQYVVGPIDEPDSIDVSTEDDSVNVRDSEAESEGVMAVI